MAIPAQGWTNGQTWNAAAVESSISYVGSYVDSQIATSAAQFLTNTGGGKDVFVTISSAGTSQTLDLSNGNEFRLTLTSSSSAITLSGATNSRVCTVTLALTQDATGGRAVTFTNTISWAGGNEPYLGATAAGSTDYLVLTTYDGGSTWYGSHSTTSLYEINSSFHATSLIETFPMEDCTGTVTSASGRVHLSFFRPHQTITCTKFVVPSGGTTTAANLTVVRFGAYVVPESFTGVMNLVCNSGNVATSGADEYTSSTGALNASNVGAMRAQTMEYRMPFSTDNTMPTSYKFLAGKWYAWGCIMYGTTSPTAGTYVGKGAIPQSMNQNWGPRRGGSLNTQTELPTGVTLSSMSTTTAKIYMGAAA